MASLLHGDRVGLFGENLPDFGEVAVESHVVLNLRRVVDECKFRVLALLDLEFQKYFLSVFLKVVLRHLFYMIFTFYKFIFINVNRILFKIS